MSVPQNRFFESLGHENRNEGRGQGVPPRAVEVVEMSVSQNRFFELLGHENRNEGPPLRAAPTSLVT